MTNRSLASAENPVVDGKGILAADETLPTLTKRFDALGIKSTEHSRRTYREMLFCSPGAGIRQRRYHVRRNDPPEKFERYATHGRDGSGVGRRR